jgi:hypothetical protein
MKSEMIFYEVNKINIKKTIRVKSTNKKTF